MVFKMNKKYFWIMIFVLILIGFFLIKPLFTGNSVSAQQGDFKIPLSEISEKAEWFEYSYNGKDLVFFVVKSEDGTIKTAFDACDVCYGSKKGYRQEGNYMVCNNCGNKYLISELGTKNKIGGGCWPGYLPNEIKGENIVIKKSDIQSGAYRF